MKKTVKDLYLEYILKYTEDNNLNLYFVNGYYYFNVFPKDMIDGLTGYGTTNNIPNNEHQKSIKNNRIENIETFNNLANNQQKWFINGLKDFYILLVDFYISLPVKMRPNIGQLLNKFKHDTRLDIYQLNILMSKRLSLSDFKLWWSFIPVVFLKISVYNEELKKIKTFLESNFEEKEVHNLLLSFIKKRSLIISKNKHICFKVKDFLIQEYENNTKLLKDFNFLPLIDNYLNRKEDYLENEIIKEVLYLEVDYLKLTSFIYRKNWTDLTYYQWINSLLKIIKENNEYIYSTKANNQNINDKKILSIYINKTTKKGISKKEIKVLIENMFNSVLEANINPISTKAKEEHVRKWFLMYKLKIDFAKEKKSYPETKRTKI